MFQQVEFKNGIYQGQLKRDSLKHGKGVFMWFSGSMYFGSWQNDQPFGEGLYFAEDGGFIKTFFIKGIPNGLAKVFSASGDIYAGSMNMGYPAGQWMKFSNVHKSTFRGNIENGVACDISEAEESLRI